MTGLTKSIRLTRLARRRQRTRWKGYKCIADYHGGAYECDHVSPYTKTAGNIDAEIMVVLQDWASDERLSGPFCNHSATLGHTPHLPTNRMLKHLLAETFGLSLNQVYGTNVFPFVKLGGMSAAIPQEDLVATAKRFTLPEIRIVNPKLVVCLGLVTFNALRQASGLDRCQSLASAIDQPFNIGKVRVWCQAHTGALGQNNRNKGGIDRSSLDWLKMKTDVGWNCDKSIIPVQTKRATAEGPVKVTRKILKMGADSGDSNRKNQKISIFILNNKTFERPHGEIYPQNKALKGVAIYDYDQRQLIRNPDLKEMRPGDLALVFGKDRTVKDVFRVTGSRATYAPDLAKEVIVIYGEIFGRLAERMIYSRFITENGLVCSRLDKRNNFTIGMIATRCSCSQDRSIEEWWAEVITKRDKRCIT